MAGRLAVSGPGRVLAGVAAGRGGEWRERVAKRNEVHAMGLLAGTPGENGKVLATFSPVGGRTGERIDGPFEPVVVRLELGRDDLSRSVAPLAVVRVGIGLLDLAARRRGALRVLALDVVDNPGTRLGMVLRDRVGVDEAELARR